MNATCHRKGNHEGEILCNYCSPGRDDKIIKNISIHCKRLPEKKLREPSVSRPCFSLRILISQAGPTPYSAAITFAPLKNRLEDAFMKYPVT